MNPTRFFLVFMVCGLAHLWAWAWIFNTYYLLSGSYGFVWFITAAVESVVVSHATAEWASES